jgi:hypothetical protein
MPLVFRWNGYRFHFFSNEGDPPEPVHIHVSRMAPTPRSGFIPRSCGVRQGLDARTLLKLSRVVEERSGEIERAWDEHFS